MSGSEELINADEMEAEGAEGNQEFEDGDDPELAQMQKELAKAEQQKAELDKLNKMQGGPGTPTAAEKAAAADSAERDARSIFIGNVDFACSVEEVQASVLAALEKNNALLRDRAIKVVNKRTNLPIWQVHPTRGGRGAPFRGRGRGFAPPFRGRGGYRGGFRGYGGRGGHYHPYY